MSCHGSSVLVMTLCCYVWAYTNSISNSSSSSSIATMASTSNAIHSGLLSRQCDVTSLTLSNKLLTSSALT